MKPSTRTLHFTQAERAEIKRRQRESEKLIARLAATETLEEQNQIAEELCPRFDDWIRGRNRIMFARRRASARPRPTRLARAARPRAKRAARTSTPSRGDPDDDPHDPEPAGGRQLQFDEAPRRIYARREIAKWIARQLDALDRMGGRR